MRPKESHQSSRGDAFLRPRRNGAAGAPKALEAHRRGVRFPAAPPTYKNAASCSSDQWAVRQALSLGTFHRQRSPLVVGDLSRVIAVIEFAEVARQMFRADMVISPDDAALQNGEVALDCVGMGLSTYIFLGLVIDGLMAREALADVCVDGVAVRHELGLPADVLRDDFPEVRPGDVRNAKRAHVAFALDQRHYRRLGRGGHALVDVPVDWFPADVGLIDFHNATKSV